MNQKTVNLDRNLHKKLKARAVEKDSTIHKELEKILEEKLEEDDKVE